MIESLLSFKQVLQRPWLTAVWSFIIANIALVLSSQVAPTFSNVSFSFFAILFIIIPSVYFMTTFIKREERTEEEMLKENAKGLWERHEKDILVFIFYFLGLTATFSIWSFILPDTAFEVQTAKINQIRGFAGAVTSSAAGMGAFFDILLNNLQVLFFSFFFAFIFGAGAIFILEWNASILGVYIGQISKSIWEVPIVTLAFLPHGIPEIGGYVTAGLAGAILSAAIVRKNTKRILEAVIMDSVKLLFLAVMLILLGAVIEVWL
ncbi:MAG: stage II sporulation protein M [Candidatus Aenigmatarchaeota archaeon]